LLARAEPRQNLWQQVDDGKWVKVYTLFDRGEAGVDDTDLVSCRHVSTLHSAARRTGERHRG
jgi:hypothetical protein